MSAQDELDRKQQVLSHFVRLIRPSSLPHSMMTSDSVDSGAQKNEAAPWSQTATETETTEVVLFPLLIHLAAAKDDLEGLNFCLKQPYSEDEEVKFKMIPGGIVNSLDPISGRSPLQVACLKGNLSGVEFLLRSGALIDLGDDLGHTALYYVSFLSRVV